MSETADLQRKLVETEAALQDQLDTAATFQQRNAELETHVLQHLKARRQAERVLQAVQQENGGLMHRLKLMGAQSGQAMPRKVPVTLPAEPAPAPAKH